jgi:hypothetical protein
MADENKTTVDENLKVNVRMYCHGLGDCFLLTFKRGEKKFNMMIDCGVLQGTEAGTDKIVQVVEDIRRNTGGTEDTPGRLDLCVVTHQHWDHISGFQQAQGVFDKIGFDEVWLAWTEDPANETAKNLGKGFKARLAGLQNALGKLKSFGLEEHKPVKDLLEGFFGENFGNFEDDSTTLGLSKKAKPQSDRIKAWDYVLKKENPYKPKYNYCYPGTELALNDFEGVRIYVLGPPTDPAKIRSLSPPSTERYRHGFNLNSFSLEDSFFVAVSDEAESGDNVSCSPFDEKKSGAINEKEVENEEYKHYEFFNNYYRLDNGQNEWRRIDNDWLSITSDLALKLDSYTNNTSLVLAIELVESGKVLLFVGDAQSGNWQSWHDHSWEIPDKNGRKQKITAEDILGRTVLYKVGHHGSHNATLKKSGLEMMKSAKDLVALIPVDTEKALSKTPKWEMPFDVLLDDLLIRTNGRVVASDRKLLKKEGSNFPEWSGFTPDPDDLLVYSDSKGQKKEPLFVDYEISG